MKYNQIFLTPANISTTGFAASVTGAAFTLTATTSGDSLAHKVTILNNTATNHSAKNITIVGFDQDGIGQTEVFSAPNSSVSVSSTKYWSILTSVTPSATIGADTFSIGWAGNYSSKTLPMNWRGGIGSLRVAVTGTINYDIQQTFDDIQFKTPPFTWSVDDSATQAGVNASIDVIYQGLPKALRILCNSYSNGAVLEVDWTQRSE